MTSIKRSNFQYSQPKVVKIIFEVNEDFNKDVYNGMPVAYEIALKNAESNNADVELSLEIGVKGIETPCYMELVISSKFIWTEDAEPIAESLLKKNAVTLLISYARPLVAHLTADAGYRPFNIPFVDLREDFTNMGDK